MIEYLISWIATVDNPTTYTITRNGEEVDSGTQISGQEITISVDDLTKGTYIYSIVVFNTLGAPTIDSVDVIITAPNLKLLIPKKILHMNMVKRVNQFHGQLQISIQEIIQLREMRKQQILEYGFQIKK